MSRSHTEYDFTGRCPRCVMRLGLCLCAEIPRVETRTHFVLLRHTLETMRSSNTARMAHLAMPNSQLVSYGAVGDRVDESVIAAPGTWLLFPEGAPLPPAPPEALSRVLVLDGSWSQARRMLQRTPALWRMPRLSLNAPTPGTLRLRQPLRADGMSTLEAIAAAVRYLEGDPKADELCALHQRMVERAMSARGRRSGIGL